MAENKKKGKLLLEEKDFVDVYDEDGNKLGYQVPKHWGPDQLAAGVTTKKPRGSRSESSDATGGTGATGSDGGTGATGSTGGTGATGSTGGTGATGSN